MNVGMIMTDLLGGDYQVCIVDEVRWKFLSEELPDDDEWEENVSLATFRPDDKDIDVPNFPGKIIDIYYIQQGCLETCSTLINGQLLGMIMLSGG